MKRLYLVLALTMRMIREIHENFRKTKCCLTLLRDQQRVANQQKVINHCTEEPNSPQGEKLLLRTLDKVSNFKNTYVLLQIIYTMWNKIKNSNL